MDDLARVALVRKDQDDVHPDQGFQTCLRLQKSSYIIRKVAVIVRTARRKRKRKTESLRLRGENGHVDDLGRAALGRKSHLVVHPARLNEKGTKKTKRSSKGTKKRRHIHKHRNYSHLKWTSRSRSPAKKTRENSEDTVKAIQSEETNADAKKGKYTEL